MGFISGAAKPGLMLFSHRRRLQIREKERAYEAWRRFAVAAEAEHAATGGYCQTAATAAHGALVAAKREVDSYGLATARGYAELVELWLHDPQHTLTAEAMIFKLAKANEEVQNDLNQFP